MRVLSILICSFIFYITPSFAQQVIQPKIMVIPYTKEGEDIRTVLETDANKRIILTKIKEAFDERGFSTIDFVAKLKAIESGEIFNLDNKNDIKAQIIDMSGADIYVEAEIVYQQNIVNGQINPESFVKIIVTAYDCATGTSLSNKIGESGHFYTKDMAKLAIRAIDSCADEFLQIMQTKFTQTIEDGRSIMLQIGFDENSVYTMESEVGSNGLLLQDEIEFWIEQHAYNNNYHLQGVSANKMIYDDIKLPLIDENTGNNYTVNRFGLELLKFFRSLNIQITRNIRGNTLYITIK